MASERDPSPGKTTDERPDDTALADAGVPDPFPGEYRVVRRLGNGKFGEVWLAEDLSPLNRPVAIKFLRLTGAEQQRTSALEVLKNEARILGTLRHPSIVQVHAWREAGRPAVPCLILQYVPGGSLEDHVNRSGVLPWHVAARYMADVAEGIRLLHARDIIHRDVKPANLLLDTEQDEALLTDFGIAARLADPASVAGTPRFMAPEGHRGENSPALDVFGLGASLFWLITHEPPFDGNSRAELRAKMEQGLAPVDRRFATMPRELERLIRATLLSRPADRPDMVTLAEHLRGSLNQCLADRLSGGDTAPVQVRLLLSRQGVGGSAVPVASSVREPDQVLRDMRRVPSRPERVILNSGDRIRIEVTADQPGYLAVFNVGPTGNLNLLYPEDPGVVSPPLAAHAHLHILDVEMTPPVGTERVFALWTRQPLALRLDDLRSLVEPTAHRATRDMTRVHHLLDRIPGTDRAVTVLEIDHR
ncbi:MAG: serine/threonine-protein kinase [Gemmataceae bacterium]